MVAYSRALTRLGRTLRVSTALAACAAGLVVAGSTTASAASVTDSAADRVGASTARLALSSDAYESRVQHYINRKRAAHGLGTLRFESCTDGVAEAWAVNLATAGALVHQDAANVMGACQARYSGETLGRGGYSPKALVRAWMRSSVHRPILLSPQARRIGIGAVNVGDRWVTTANFTRF